MAVTHGDEQAPSEEDPFAGLVLDESFVQAAKVAEAPARTRHAIARYAHLERPANGTGRPPEHGSRSRKRRWITVTAVVTVAALLGYIVWLTGRPSHASSAGAPLTNATPSPNPAPSIAPSPNGLGTPTPQPTELSNWQETRPIGQCVTWQPYERAPITAIPCSDTHLAQITGNIDVSGRFGKAWPGLAALKQVGVEVCAAPFQAFTGASPAAGYALGYAPGSLHPLEDSWDRGAHHITCTAEALHTAPFKGSVQGLHKPVTT